LEVVLAKGFARIHWQNLVNFGVLPLTFADPSDYDRLHPGDVIEIREIGRIPSARLGHRGQVERRRDLDPPSARVCRDGKSRYCCGVGSSLGFAIVSAKMAPAAPRSS
jgi:aconitate hydratase